MLLTFTRLENEIWLVSHLFVSKRKTIHVQTFFKKCTNISVDKQNLSNN